MEFQIKKVEKGDIDTEELKKQIPGWCSLLKKSPDDERLRIIVASMFYFIDEKEKSLAFESVLCYTVEKQVIFSLV